MRCLVTGSTGYLGGRLVPRLLEEGRDVRVLARSPERLRDVAWSSAVEITRGDVLDAQSLTAALDGVDVAYYLVHSMTAAGRNFAETDRRAAETFAAAAARARVGRVIYLGGLTPTDAHDLSPHLRSRQEVADILLASGVPTAVLQAAVVLGSGSASFEMLRYLTERLPVMVTPKWVRNPVQPIAVRDVLRYLVESATMPASVNRRFDIGGPDILSYGDMMAAYARVAGLPNRPLFPVPLLTPSLSSLWVGAITPVPASIARPLVESLRHEAICNEHDIREYVPDPPEGLLGVDEAIRLALRRIGEASVETRWSSASWPGAPSDPLPTDPDWAGGSLYVDERRTPVNASPEALWRVLEGIGGDRGWYSFPLAWRARGALDRMVGGVGLRRGRRDSDHLYVGETLDFWRVEEMIPGTLLRLRAEMRLPGLAWLELGVQREPDGSTTYVQRALFAPRGIAGHAYWKSVAPFHSVVFGGMARHISAAAQQSEATASPPAGNPYR